MLKKKACGTLVGESGETVIRDVLFDGRSEELSLEVMGQGRGTMLSPVTKMTTFEVKIRAMALQTCGYEISSVGFLEGLTHE